MAESFLEDQLKRIREWTVRMAEVQSYAAQSRQDFTSSFHDEPEPEPEQHDQPEPLRVEHVRRRRRRRR